MPQRNPLPDDPQQPSTSTATQRRHAGNREEFERLFSKKPPPNLWNICTTRGRGKPTYTCQSLQEIRSLRGVNFKTILKPHEKFLTDLALLCSSTFAELCQQLRFLAFHKKLPAIIATNPKKEEDAREFFKVVACCIQYRADADGLLEWTAHLNQETLMDRMIVKGLDRLNIAHEKKEIADDVPTTSKSSELLRYRRVPIKEQFNPSSDENLRDQHYLDDIGSNEPKFMAMMDKLTRILCRNNMAIRTKEEELSDVDYYGDDQSLMPPQVTFRLDNLMQIPDFKFPENEEDGYFPPERNDHAWYLYEQYEKAHSECTAAFAVLRPNGFPMPKGFEKSYFVSTELLEFHSIGRHIHGFFEVWKEADRGWKDRKSGQWVSRRYLVDIYNRIRFPLYVKFERWSLPLRWAFDKLSLYSLKLMTMVRKHSKELKTIGDLLFTRYPGHILDGAKFSITSAKGRQHYVTAYQLDNGRLVEKCLTSIQFPKMPPVEDDIRKRKRRGRKSDEDPAPKMARTPRKQIFSPSSLSTTPPTTIIAQAAAALRTMAAGGQKENLLMSPPPAAPLVRRRSSVESPRRPQQPAVTAPAPAPSVAQAAVKRRNEEQLQVPPAKKPSLDSWDEHVHNSMEEEHVDEEEPFVDDDTEEPRDNIGADGMVWVPQDRGFEVAPEQYAKEILEHYGVKTGEEDEEQSAGAPAPVKSSVSAPALSTSAPVLSGPLADLVADISQSGPVLLPPPIPAPKQRRSRKSNNKTEPVVVAEPIQEEQPSTSEPPVTPSNGIMIPVRSMSTPKQRVYSIKHTPPPPQSATSKAVYPVKKLAGASNGVHPVGFINQAALKSGSYLPTSKRSVAAPPPASQLQPIGLSKEAMALASSMGTKQPYFPTGMRHKNGVVDPTAASTSSIANTPFRPAVAGTLRAMHRAPMIIASATSTPQNSNASATPNPASTPSPRNAQSSSESSSSAISTPASRALVQQRLRQMDYFPDSAKCRRAMSYNDQMEYKNRKWDPLSMKSVQPTVAPRPSPVAAAATPIQPYRPRSYSNQNGSGGAPTTTTPAEPTPEPVKPRAVVPWNRTPVTTDAMPLVQQPPPMLLPIAVPQFPPASSGPLLLPTYPVIGPTPIVIQRTTTTAYTVMDSNTAAAAAQNPPPPVVAALPGQLLSIGSYTKMVRKSHGGTLTPEELGDAVRTESQRFHEATGEEGPTVKSFLLNLQQK